MLSNHSNGIDYELELEVPPKVVQEPMVVKEAKVVVVVNLVMPEVRNLSVGFATQ